MCSGCQLAGPMAYITHNGTTTTLRALFRLMPPTTHHHEPEQSKVLAYIMELLGCTLEDAQRRFNSMRNPSSMVLRYDRNNAAWRGCDWMPDDQHDRETEAARSMRDMQKESKKTKTVTKKAFSEINVLKQDMDEVYTRMEEFNARLNEWKIILQSFEKTLGEIRQEVKAISDLKAEVGSKYRFLIGSDELQDERLAVLEKRLGIDYLAGTPADSTQPS